MRASLLFLILVILGCTKKTTEIGEASARMDTLLLQMYLNNPVEFDSSSAIKDECVLLNASGTLRDRYRCFYVLDRDTLATITFTKFRTDSTWLFGTNGYKVEEFECRDKRVPLRLGLGIGARLEDFERQLGSFEAKQQGVYSKSFMIGSEEINLTIETKQDRVTGVLITAVNKP